MISKSVFFISASLIFGTLLFAANPGVPAHFAGGTISGLHPNSSARIDVTQEDVLVLYCGKSVVRVPYKRINALEYGQNVNRRYAAAILISPMLLLAKSRRHYVTVAYRDEEDRQQAVVLRVGKGEIRSLLASLEARSGRKVEYSDNEARKTGKG